jgi:hypothetical protein
MDGRDPAVAEIIAAHGWTDKLKRGKIRRAEYK